MSEKKRNVRLVARLDIKGANLIKGLQFEGLRVIGSPNDFARSYYAQGADELLYIDNVASLYERSHFAALLADVLRDVFIPVTVAGGIRSVHDVRVLLRAGADKVALNTAATKRPGLITEIAETFGSQCVAVSIEAKQREGMWWEAFAEGGREPTGLKVVDWAQEAVSLGAGEILLTSIDKDGLEQGFDLELVKSVDSVSSVPVIPSGGLGTLNHAYTLLNETSAEGVALGSAAHYGRLRFDDLRKGLFSEGYDVL